MPQDFIPAFKHKFPLAPIEFTTMEKIDKPGHWTNPVRRYTSDGIVFSLPEETLLRLLHDSETVSEFLLAVKSVSSSE